VFNIRRAKFGIAVAAFMALTAGARGVSAAAPVSDDFNSVALNTNLWTIYNPAGDGAVVLNGSHLQLSLPAGQPHDLWTSGNQSLRVLQPMANEDFYVEAKFDSPVSSTIQDQGIIVAQDAGTYVRFDVYRNGSAINYFSASFVNNQPTVRVSRAITVTRWPIYLRVQRQGSTWTGMWSTDGINFAIATRFTLNMTAAQIGPFAANNSSPAPAFNASIDYFHNLLDTGSGSGSGNSGVADLTAIVSHSAEFVSGSQGTYTIRAANAGSAASTGTVTITDTLPAGLVPMGVSASGWNCQISGQTVTCSTGAAIAAGQSSQPITLVVNVTGAPGSVTNSVTISGGGETNTANNSASDATTISSGQTSTVTPVSDEFNAVALNTNLWTIYNPAGDGSVTLNGSNLLLGLPAGQPHDLWTGGNQSLRILQPMTNGDFNVEVKFDSPVSNTIQDEGIIVAQDTNTYVRFDVYRNGSSVNYFSANFANNNPTVRASRAITVNKWPLYLRVQRQGSTWTGTWSTDGVNFTVGTQFTLNMTAAQIGPFAANNGSSAPAFTASIDYFRNLLDGSGGGSGSGNPGEPGTPDLTASVSHASSFVAGSQGTYTLKASNVGSAASAGQITMTDSLPTGLTPVSATGSGWACAISGQTVTCNTTALIAAGQTSQPITLLANVIGLGSVTNVASVSGGGETNAANNSASDPTTITGVTGQGPVSDDFHSSTLNSTLWTFVNPKGDGSVKLENNHAQISVPAGSSHDIWTGGNNSARLMQAAANADFDVELKLDSAVDLPCQMQGILVQQDLNNYLRFDVYSSGTYAHLFVASFANGAPTVLLDRVIGEGITLPFFLRVRRTGDVFSYQTSTNGYTFSEAVHFTRRLTVSQVGPFAGNNACGYTAPAFTSSIDYFFNTAAPILPQDGVAGTKPVINVWYGDNQTFGQNGIPQTWINILGTVLSPNGSLKSLQYKLNGGAAQPLWVGPDVTRLNQPGDFNVEIAYSSLRPGANTVSIVATDLAGEQTTHDVTVNYVTGKTWPLPYTINWTPSTKLQDVVQVVDGKWEIQPDGTVRTEQVGYDRLLDIGDMSAWKNYVVTAEVTVHYINDSNIPAPPSHTDNVFGVGFVVGWKGHTKDVFGRPSSEQPGVGHPFPAVGWYSNSGGIGPYLSLYQNTPSHHESVMAYLPSNGLALKFETKYVFKMQVKANPDNRSSHFSFKAWPASSPEPSQWSVQADGDLSQGSVLLGAHRTDVSFGKITVAPVP